MTYEFKCGTCGRLKEVSTGISCGHQPEGAPLLMPRIPPNPDCDFCQERMHRVYTFVLSWPKSERGH